MKKIITIVALGIIVSITSLSFAQVSNTNITWRFSNDSLIISGAGDMDNFKNYHEAPWRYVANYARYITIYIDSGITSIGTHAFDGGYMGKVILPNTVTRIGNYAFQDFITSNLSPTIVLPNSVTSIGDYAFSGCNMTSINFPSSVTEIGIDAFYECPNLNSMLYNSLIFAYMPPSSSITNYTIPYGIEIIAGGAFKKCSGIQDIIIPNSVKIIGRGAFGGCSGLSSIYIPESITNIGNRAFYSCNITTVYMNSNHIMNDNSMMIDFFDKSVGEYIIGDSVKSLGEYVFGSCSGLSSVLIPNSIKSIGRHAFERCKKLTSIIIPDSICYVGAGAFTGCSGLVAVKISSLESWCRIEFESYDANPLSVAHHLFLNDSEITSLVLPNNIESVRDYAFYNCSGITSISIPYNIDSIGNYAFYGCEGLTSINIPNNVKSLGDYSFSKCNNLTGITINDGVKSIGEYAFSNCGEIRNISLPNSVTFVGNRAFYGSDSINSPIYNSHVFAYMPRSYVGSYFIQNGTESIAGSAFINCKDLSEIIIPNSVTSIGETAFKGCDSLASVVIPENVKSIRYEAFRNCTDLASVTINSDSVLNKSFVSTNNMPSIFGSQVTEYIIGPEVRGIGASAFSSSLIGSITIPDSVISIGQTAFVNCKRIKNVVLGKSLNLIGDGAFYGCDSITYITCFSITPPDVIEDALVYNFPSYPILSVPAESLSAYQNHSFWGRFITIPLPYSNIQKPINDESISDILKNPKTRIYTIQGDDVSARRNSLSEGVYILRLGEQTIKTFITNK